MLMESNENRHFEGPERVNIESLGDPVGAFTNNSFSGIEIYFNLFFSFSLVSKSPLPNSIIMGKCYAYGWKLLCNHVFNAELSG